MCVQTPGSFLWSGSLAARVGLEGWSTWGVCLVTGTLQGVLLTMGIAFELQNHKKKKTSAKERDEIDHQENPQDPGSVEEDDRSNDETTPLLGK